MQLCMCVRKSKLKVKVVAGVLLPTLTLEEESRRDAFEPVRATFAVPQRPFVVGIARGTS